MSSDSVAAQDRWCSVIQLAIFDREECEPGLACVAAPVLRPGAVCVGAVSITGPVGRLRPERLTPAVRTTALAIANVLR